MRPRISVDVLPPLVVEKWAQSTSRLVESATNLQALIDTGASVTGIGENTLNKLGYPPVGVANLASPSGVTQTGIYVVRLVIPSKSDLNFPPNIPE
ncbi:MAG: hypothetical protein ACP5M7_09235 [Thermoproteota archaeon]